jgi:hypothetical protein
MLTAMDAKVLREERRRKIILDLIEVVIAYDLKASILTHAGRDMPDNVRVLRVGILPPASFRFHLTMDTLAIG